MKQSSAELLEDVSIEKLVMLIDALDRYLPDVVINALETVRSSGDSRILGQKTEY